ncbi:MAG: nucleotidyltransferase domain-containing protein [Desulfohalobiaceae bacterium]|jgi:predicted nucleotidyltransferase|nr:nucleotidyltransferase domain-containing protein [Desulfohalobiaceae bacterium]
MRIRENEKNAILQAVRDIDPKAKVYLFGSRVDESKKGGDIDLLIFSNRISFQDKLTIKARIFETIEEQKMDLLIAENLDGPFVQMAYEKSVELT